MLKEALQYLVSLSDRAGTAKPLEGDADPRVRRYIINGALEEIPQPGPRRQHKAQSLAAFVDYINKAATAEPKPPAPPVVWYNATALVGILDDAGHRIERVELPLVMGAVFKRIIQLGAPGADWFEQKEFIRLLRIELAGALPPVSLLEKVRRVRFANSNNTVKEARHARESLGAEITSQIETESDLPELVTLSAPMYLNPGISFQASVACAVEVDPARGAFKLTPMPDEIDRAFKAGMEYLRGLLDVQLDDAVPRYYGQP